MMLHQWLRMLDVGWLTLADGQWWFPGQHVVIEATGGNDQHTVMALLFPTCADWASAWEGANGFLDTDWCCLSRLGGLSLAMAIEKPWWDLEVGRPFEGIPTALCVACRPKCPMLLCSITNCKQECEAVRQILLPPHYLRTSSNIIQDETAEHCDLGEFVANTPVPTGYELVPISACRSSGERTNDWINPRKIVTLVLSPIKHC